MIRTIKPAPSSPVNSMNLAFAEELYAKFLADPASVPDDWRAYFAEMGGNGAASDWKPGPSFRRPPEASLASPPRSPRGARPSRRDMETALRQDRVDQLIRAYRVRGHLVAKINPLDLPRPAQQELDLSFYGFSEADLDSPFSTNSISGPNVRTLREILDLLKATYCRAIGVQFMHIDDYGIKDWLQNRMEGTENRCKLSREEQRRIYARLTDAVIFEEFIQKKFVGAKSFSLEGGESLIPLLDLAVERAGRQGIDEVVIGMAHRGRLNVLANILGKPARRIFREFEDKDPEIHRGRGDVKYHLGYSSDWKTASGQVVHLSLMFNPSHLEFVNPVALGRTRAKQDHIARGNERSMCLLIHGDAAFVGEGIVQETLNLSQLAAYETGGTIHVIVNNQLGFTTPPSEYQSTTYASDIAKMLQIPIFHVNGENPEAVAQVINLALEFRQKFHRDVVIDMLCYRRRGHNETDEPAFTQPLLYQAIDKRDLVSETYLDHLLLMGGLTVDEAEQIANQRREQLEADLSMARGQDKPDDPEHPTGAWKGYFGGPVSQADQVATGVSKDRLASLLDSLSKVPAGFSPHPKIERELKSRLEMARGERSLNWAAAEMLAFGSLALDGYRVRLTGQDCGRGTFSHRHAILHDYKTGKSVLPLERLSPEQAPVAIHNSSLSEAGVMGFEYGYSLGWPDGLILWEAQYGDFCNVAQVIIDQFIVSGEDKWYQLSGLVLLLPHGFEGSGPEHSSARLERFLTLAAEDNIQVGNLTTPAQYFHLLRQQAMRKWRKPLVLMTPKSLLRHPSCVSSLDDLAIGRFQPVLADARPREKAKGTSRVLLCSGKIYYELEQRRAELAREDVAIVRLEMIYPFPDRELQEALAAYPEGTPAYWVQEEPENMGSWRFLYAINGPTLFGRFPFRAISRQASASPATGSASCHKLEQREILAAAMGEVG